MATKAFQAEFGIEINKTIIYSAVGGMIEAVTSSPLSLEGKRPTLVILNEVQWWHEANDGHAMFDVIEGNLVAKAKTSTYQPGRRSPAWLKHPLIQTTEVIVCGWRHQARGASAHLRRTTARRTLSELLVS